MIFGISRKNNMATGGHFVYIAQKACGVSNFVINSPIILIFGIVIDNTYCKNIEFFRANRNSKMAAGDHFEEEKKKLCIDLKWREMRSKVIFIDPKWPKSDFQ